MSPAQIVDLTSKSESLEAKTGRQFVIATVPSLEDRTVEEYATGLFRHWGIGDKKRDDGVLLLVAPKERKVRIENDLAGQGATSRVTGAYFADGVQHLDYDTFQEHIAPNTTSDFAFKGALRDTSTAVWRGMIRVEPDGSALRPPPAAITVRGCSSD